MCRMSAGVVAFLLLCVAARASKVRIVGGKLANISEFPFLASLQRRDLGHCCVANVVTYRWLLTAAHCVSTPLDCHPRDFVVVAGVTNLTAARRGLEGQRGWPDLFVVHPLMRSASTFDYDLALVRLELPLKEGRRVSSVALAWDVVPPQLLYSAPCTVAGWGNTERVAVARRAERPGMTCRKKWEDRALRKVELSLLDTYSCSRLLQRQLREYVHLCAYSSDRDACQGDSGAALICQGVQVGVVSWGKGCASDYPGVYARVDTQMAWLMQVISDQAPPLLPLPLLAAACCLAALVLSLP